MDQSMSMDWVLDSGKPRPAGQSRSRGSRSNWGMDAIFSHSNSFSASSRREEEDDEEALRWAAIERLPTYDRLRTSILRSFAAADEAPSFKGKTHVYAHREVDVRALGDEERREFLDNVLKVTEEDNEKFLTKLRNRIDKVGISLPTVEVRFENLTVEARCHVGERALPSLANVARDMAESFLSLLGIRAGGKMTTLTILKDATGIIKPSRMTLLLGPPSSGKTTLLLALAGKLDSKLCVKGSVMYNGHDMHEFVPQKTSAYISQNDIHAGEMTVKETFDFSARCQGIGTRYELLTELIRREKEAGILPEADVDLFMKETAMEGEKNSLLTDYTIRILDLNICKDTIVGDEMRRGISGGQKKRVTTGEIIVGPTKTLFMDEISTGLDSSTTFQVVKCIQQMTHLNSATVVMSLLQPTPETFDLFDDVILLSEGHIVYHGPRTKVLDFFQSCGFQCPERKGTADFLQEVTSRKDQEQYWSDPAQPYSYVSVPEFARQFRRHRAGRALLNSLATPFDKAQSHRAALSFSSRPVPGWDLLMASFSRELLLMHRNSFLYIFKTFQIVTVAIICSTVFFRGRMHDADEIDGEVYVGALLFALITNMFNGFAELAVCIQRLPVFYKQRDLLFYPAWAYTLPTFLLGIPISMMESAVWVTLTYYSIGFAPEASRFFKQFLLVFLIQQMAAGLFRVTAGLCRTMIIANSAGSIVMVIMFMLGGFILPREDIPRWWIWGYWVSPLAYAFNGLAVNEMFSPRWMEKVVPDGRKLGIAVLEDFSIFPKEYWYWISVGGLLGFTVVFNILYTVALMYLSPPGRPQAVISKEIAAENEAKRNGPNQLSLQVMRRKDEPLLQSASTFEGNATSFSHTPEELTPTRVKSFSEMNGSANPSFVTANGSSKRGMILPFIPLSMAFNDINYYVDMPPAMKEHGEKEDRLQLLRDVTGAFRPGVLTALMGVSGAGKTTLMDVLAGRKTGGYIEGDIRISGYPKNQVTFARISGYCEQTDIHSPQVTVHESLIYSAFMRLPEEIHDTDKMIFVEEVMELVELDNLKDALVGLPGITGLSTEQRKRLTVAVELVANPSIIFMDEPTSGLDARAAAVVMRTVRNTVDTGRTVVCTIHQPSTDIFEAFDELMLMKRGGQVIYSGPLGQRSRKVVEFFESIPEVPKITEKYNPATWMLEATSLAIEVQHGIDFSDHYKASKLYQRSKALVRQLSKPPPGSSDLSFPTMYSQSTLRQFKCCLWKQSLTYWRSPDYNLVRFFFTLVSALLFATMFWKIGLKRESAIDLNIIVGAMYASVLFVGFNNCSTVQPMIAIERTVFYRERAAGMYSAIPYAIAQVVVEIPYVFIQSAFYTLIIYWTMYFQWTAAKFFWFFFMMFFTLLYFTYYGMMIVSVSPNAQVGGILAATFYTLFNLFSGFFIPKPRIPKWWVWYYWICPVAWSINGFITTQYGDQESMIKVPGLADQSIKFYIQDHFGFTTHMELTVAVVLVGFTVLFGSVYAYCIKSLNFQNR